MQYCFYSKNNPSQEPVGLVNAASREEAVRFFSLTKQLTVNDFLTIFEVKSYEFKEGIKEGNKQLLKG